MRIFLGGLLILAALTASESDARAANPPVGLEQVRERLQSGETTRVVCFGDSITGAYYHTGGLRAWCDMLGLALERIEPNARLEMINAGVSGQTTVDGLARIQREVLDRQPHLVVVMFGMNDVTRVPLETFVANLQAITQKCHAAGAAVVLCTPNSVYENPARPMAKLAEYSARIRQLTQAADLPLVDCFEEYRTLRERDELAWMLLMSDEIHPNMHGHRRFAEQMAEAITGRRIVLDHVPPPPDALHHTLSRLQAGESVHLVAMPPYDEWFAAALRQRFPQAEIRVTVWPTEAQSVHDLSIWAKGIRALKPDLVVPAVPAATAGGDVGSDVRDYEWVLNWSFPFAGRDWDVVPVLPSLAAEIAPDEQLNARIAHEIVAGKDVRFLERIAGDVRSPQEILASWIDEQDQTRPQAWPGLPESNATVSIPAQEWPQRPGPRQVAVRVHYPGGQLARVTPQTGVMLTLHNWGGEFCVSTADPQSLADRLNVVALCVNYLQSGRADSIDGPEPYDFGYLQSLDALRALWWTINGLHGQQRPFAEGRLFATGGSGGGNVTLMANKLAPRTFACVVDLCGMKQLSADIAFHLPGGSDLNARWSRDPASPGYLSLDDQDLRFIGHPEHLQSMHRLGTSSRIVIVHGVDDATCPFPDARELVANLQSVGLAVEPHFVTPANVGGKVFTGTGHALGNLTEIVFQVAGEYLSAAGPRRLVRAGRSDFDRRDEVVQYRTPGGQFVISYAAGYPVGRFEPDPPPAHYGDHQDLSIVIDQFGQRRQIQTPEDWQIRRQQIQDNLQTVMGRLPGASFRVPLDVRVVAESRDGKIIRRKLSFQSDPFDRVTAWLLLPDVAAGKPSPAVLCLHQTIGAGKDEPVGLAGSPNMHYGRELAERGYVVLAPDYPSMGEHAYDFAQHPEFASGSLKAVWDNIRAVDLLSALPEVDRERIGVIGHSLGGHNALFTAVFEPRLKAVVSSCGFTSLQKDDLPSWTGPRYMPRISGQFGADVRRLPFDFHEVVGGLAPRPFLACAATGDGDFDVEGVRDVIAAARAVYRLLGQPDHLRAEYPESSHDFPTATRQQAYRFLDLHLKAKE